MRSEAKFVYYAIFHEIDIPKTGGVNNIEDPPLKNRGGLNC